MEVENLLRGVDETMDEPLNEMLTLDTSVAHEPGFPLLPPGTGVPDWLDAIAKSNGEDHGNVV